MVHWAQGFFTSSQLTCGYNFSKIGKKNFSSMLSVSIATQYRELKGSGCPNSNIFFFFRKKEKSNLEVKNIFPFHSSVKKSGKWNYHYHSSPFAWNLNLLPITNILVIIGRINRYYFKRITKIYLEIFIAFLESIFKSEHFQ